MRRRRSGSSRFEVREPGQPDRRDEGERYRSGPDRLGQGNTAAHDRGSDEPRPRPGHCEPDRPGRPADDEEVRELSRVDELQEPADAERGQAAGEAVAAEDARRPRDGERDRQEDREPPRLRDRDRVGEVVERPGHEHEGEDGERCAEDVRGPAPRAREGGCRNCDQPGHRHRAASGDRLGREPEQTVDDVDLVPVVGDRPPPLGRVGTVRDGLVDDRLQPQRVQAGWDEDCRDGSRDPQVLAPQLRREHGPREEEADERNGGKERVGRVDEREGDRRGRDRQHLSAPPSRRQREDEREQRRDDQSPGHCRRQREEVERPRAGPREADQPDLGSRDRDPAAVRAEERGAGGVGEHDGERRQDRGHVQHRGRGVDVREARHERNRRMPGRERIARMQTAVLELVRRR